LSLSAEDALSNENTLSDEDILSNDESTSSDEGILSENESISSEAFSDLVNHKKVDDNLYISDMEDAFDIADIILEENHSGHNVHHQFKQVQDIRDELLGDYRLPTDPPSLPPILQILTRSQELSLEHYIAWSKSKGTVKACNMHAAVLEKAAGTKILFLYLANKLAISLTELIPIRTDMCPASCIAYTGRYENYDTSPYPLGKNILCGKPHYKTQATSFGKKKPYAQVITLPIIPTIKALYANAETFILLRQRDTHLKQALHLVYTASHTKTYSDFSDSHVHCMHHESMGLFKDKRDIAFVLSTDGAQLTMKKQSNTWLVIFILFNLPDDMRYKKDGIIIPLATPGPNSPGDIESFLYPMFQNMAMASEGIWIWDAVDSSYFILRAYICMILGDMLGSAKLSSMAGHSAIFGDRFSLVQGACSKISRGAKAQYYPMSPPDNDAKQYNPNRPTYDLNNLPMRTESHYWSTIKRLSEATTKKTVDDIVKTTGISHLPLCAASLAFSHPNFFPPDPFHLIYENCMAFIFDVWVKSLPPDGFYISENKLREFGLLVSQAIFTLPSSFCGPIRDPFLKRHSQYKIYEWMALLHWYIIPIGIELGFNSIVLQNFLHFVQAMEFLMTLLPRSESDLDGL
jgi:hypothetical protein